MGPKVNGNKFQELTVQNIHPDHCSGKLHVCHDLLLLLFIVLYDHRRCCCREWRPGHCARVVSRVCPRRLSDPQTTQHVLGINLGPDTTREQERALYQFETYRCTPCLVLPDSGPVIQVYWRPVLDPHDVCGPVCPAPDYARQLDL